MQLRSEEREDTALNQTYKADITDELERLHTLHSVGALTKEEFERAKEAVLDGETQSPISREVQMSLRLRKVEREQEIDRIDEEWQRERKKLCSVDSKGQLQIPRHWEADAAAIIFGLAAIIFVLMGVSGNGWLFLSGIGFGGMAFYFRRYFAVRADAYAQAEKRYHNQRDEALSLGKQR